MQSVEGAFSDMCGLQILVEMYITPKGPFQCKRSQRFGHMHLNCRYALWYVACGETFLGSAVPQCSSLSAAAAR